MWITDKGVHARIGKESEQFLENILTSPHVYQPVMNEVRHKRFTAQVKQPA